MEYVEEEERLIEAGELDAAVELNLAFWCPDDGRPGAPDGRRPLSSARTTSSTDPDLGAVRAPTLVAVGEHDKADFRAIAERLARELPDARAGGDRGRGPPAVDGAPRGDGRAGAELPSELGSACDAARCLGLLVALALALVPAASAQAAECPPGSPTLVVMVNGKTCGPVYTTHDLLVRARLSGGAYYTVNSFDVAGLRRMPDPDDDEATSERGLRDRRRARDAHGHGHADERRPDPHCTVSGTVSFEVKPATTPIVSNLRRPPAVQGAPRLALGLEVLVLGEAGPDRQRLAAHRRGARHPAGARARARGAARSASRSRCGPRTARGPTRSRTAAAGTHALICPRGIRTWPNGAEVDVFPKGGSRCRAAS